jgi:translation initiation factor 3 subunit M
VNCFLKCLPFLNFGTTEIEGFFNLLYSHLLTLWPVDSTETKTYVTDLLHVVSSSPAADASIKYRV